jgi:hypothetical protein
MVSVWGLLPPTTGREQVETPVPERGPAKNISGLPEAFSLGDCVLTRAGISGNAG